MRPDEALGVEIDEFLAGDGPWHEEADDFARRRSPCPRRMHVVVAGHEDDFEQTCRERGWHPRRDAIYIRDRQSVRRTLCGCRLLAQDEVVITSLWWRVVRGDDAVVVLRELHQLEVRSDRLAPRRFSPA